MKIEKISGTVEAVRKDGKGFMLDNEQWYSNNRAKGKVACEKGDKVEVEFTRNGEWKNYTSVKVTEKKAIQTQETRIDVNASQLCSYAKDLVVGAMDKGIEVKSIPEAMKTAANAVAEAYLLIKAKITQPQGREQETEAIKGEEEPEEEY